MPAITEETAYLDLQVRIRDLLGNGLKQKQVSMEQVFAILVLLARATNQMELETFSTALAGSFPILKKIGQEQRDLARGPIEAKVNAAVSAIVSRDPVLAAKIAKAAMEPGISWEDLTARFPELKKI